MQLTVTTLDIYPELSSCLLPPPPPPDIRAYPDKLFSPPALLIRIPVRIFSFFGRREGKGKELELIFFFWRENLILSYSIDLIDRLILECGEFGLNFERDVIYIYIYFDWEGMKFFKNLEKKKDYL